MSIARLEARGEAVLSCLKENEKCGAHCQTEYTDAYGKKIKLLRARYLELWQSLWNIGAGLRSE